jgi:hypothetical protein
MGRGYKKYRKEEEIEQEDAAIENEDKEGLKAENKEQQTEQIFFTY